MLTQTQVLLFTLAAMAAPLVGYAFGWLCDMVREVWLIVVFLLSVNAFLDHALSLRAMFEKDYPEFKS